MQSLYWSIDRLPGLSQQELERLRTLGIHNTQELLSETNNPALKQQLASNLQLHLKHIQKWSILADLARIPSINCQYCGLLLHTGVISSAQLSQIPVHRLHQQVLRFYVSNLQRRDLCPSINLVGKWIEEARSMPKARYAPELVRKTN
jgi:hypothetical protein